MFFIAISSTMLLLFQLHTTVMCTLCEPLFWISRRYTRICIYIYFFSVLQINTLQKWLQTNPIENGAPRTHNMICNINAYIQRHPCLFHFNVYFIIVSLLFIIAYITHSRLGTSSQISFSSVPFYLIFDGFMCFFFTSGFFFHSLRAFI